jgi:hypothetical protein
MAAVIRAGCKRVGKECVDDAVEILQAIDEREVLDFEAVNVFVRDPDGFDEPPYDGPASGAFL